MLSGCNADAATSVASNAANFFVQKELSGYGDRLLSDAMFLGLKRDLGLNGSRQVHLSSSSSVGYAQDIKALSPASDKY